MLQTCVKLARSLVTYVRFSLLPRSASLLSSLWPAASVTAGPVPGVTTVRGTIFTSQCCDWLCLCLYCSSTHRIAHIQIKVLLGWVNYGNKGRFSFLLWKIIYQFCTIIMWGCCEINTENCGFQMRRKTVHMWLILYRIKMCFKN